MKSIVLILKYFFAVVGFRLFNRDAIFFQFSDGLKIGFVAIKFSNLVSNLEPTKNQIF
jgi:hypothetical protein